MYGENIISSHEGAPLVPSINVALFCLKYISDLFKTKITRDLIVAYINVAALYIYIYLGVGDHTHGACLIVLSYQCDVRHVRRNKNKKRPVSTELFTKCNIKQNMTGQLCIPLRLSFCAVYFSIS